ncbi:unnamed protein product [Urochloa decumbens]|uniref:Uncharacterized protein n=1 Tax=Urochloa decumbens TaxID=240449 RepID=A0ABC9GGI6_9POAL
MASKSIASTASLFLAVTLMLAASKQAQARPPAPTPAPAPAPGPSQGFCPTGFRNFIEFTKAVPEYDAMGVLLSFSVYPPSSGLPGVVVGSRTCICYFPNIFAILFLGPLDCVTAA